MINIKLVLGALAIITASCGGEANSKVEAAEESVVETDSIILKEKEAENVTADVNNDPKFANLLGSYNGEMGGKPLIIEITSIVNGEVVGFNVLGENNRPLKGTCTETEERADGPDYFMGCDFILNEPGDDEWDGVFEIQFDGYGESEGSEGDRTVYSQENIQYEIKGKWKANNGKLERTFQLK